MKTKDFLSTEIILDSDESRTINNMVSLLDEIKVKAQDEKSKNGKQCYLNYMDYATLKNLKNTLADTLDGIIVRKDLDMNEEDIDL